MTTALPGVWTPSAQVLCSNCFGPQWGVMWRYPLPVEVSEGEDITTCDRCARPVTLDAGIAAEHGMSLRLRAAGFDVAMMQTGGMCSAIGRAYGDNRCLYIGLYDWDGNTSYRWMVSADNDGESISLPGADSCGFPRFRSDAELIAYMPTLMEYLSDPAKWVVPTEEVAK